jgi:LysM repeat protein
MNWFVYCRNNPLKYVDPDGLLSYVASKDQWIIEKGDTLTSIAKETGFTVQEILEVNPNITNSDLIIAGTPINIPQTERIRAFQWAMQQVGSRAYALDANLGPGFEEGKYKCNAFVRDAYEKGAGVDYPNHRGPSGWFNNVPPSAYAHFINDKLGPLSSTNTQKIGDVLTTGVHMGIVGLKGQYINASSRTNTVIITPIPDGAKYMTYTK